jgi:hypothetical protein
MVSGRKYLIKGFSQKKKGNQTMATVFVCGNKNCSNTKTYDSERKCPNCGQRCIAELTILKEKERYIASKDRDLGR